MGTHVLISFGTAEELAQAAAARWLEQVRSGDSAGVYTVALPGGRIAGRFFSAVAAIAGATTSLPNNMHFFWGDERCVPPADPASNYALARRHLLEPLGIPGDRIHRLTGELSPSVAASRGEMELRRFAMEAASGQPILDLVLLGMGEDGHVASLFPGESDAAANDPAVYRPVVAVKPPPQRITLGYGALAAAHRVWVLASGPGKEGALRESLRSGGRTPLARVLRSRGETQIFTDWAV